MLANMYYSCKICGSVSNIKYQLGYSIKHPIRYVCKCGVSIRGSYEKGRGIVFENASEIKETTPSLVVYCSGEFFTFPPYSVQSFEETICFNPSPFIHAMQLLDYERYRKELSHILSYRDNKHVFVRAVNELYDSGNCERAKEVIRNHFDPNETLFPLNNKADYIRSVSMINQIQFLNYDGVNRTPKTTNLIVSTIKNHIIGFDDFLCFIEKYGQLETWKRQIHRLCDEVYEKIDLLMPAVSVDFLKDRDSVNLECYAITTSTFGEIKQLYVDLYEMIGNLLVIVIGLDNIILRGDYNAIKEVPGISVSDLLGVRNMRNKGNIIKLIDESAPFEALLCNGLNSSIRNSIGHYSYNLHETVDSYGRLIEFYDPYNKEKIEVKSLLQICCDIWQMYKTLGIFNEIIHHLEIQQIARNGESPSFITDANLFKKLVHNPSNVKIGRNDPCPCGSGFKYKKCCGR